jgi:hypothetical protein
MKKREVSMLAAPVLFLALAFTACSNPNGGGTVNDGSDPANPVTKVITGRNISQNWADIVNAVTADGKYVILDLSACTADDNAIEGDENDSPQSGMNIFYDNPYIKGIILPSTLVTIGEYAFIGCKYLTSISIPNSVTSIGSLAFLGCESLTSITVAESNPSLSSQDGVVFNKAKTELILCPAGKGGAYTVPANVTTIRNSAFLRCENLTSISIPASVTAIGEMAVYNCASLTSVTFGEGSSIDEGGFADLYPFDGDLRAKYLDGEGGAGTYTRSGAGTTESPYVWTKQGGA